MGPTIGPGAGRLTGIFGGIFAIFLSLAAAGCVNVAPGTKEPARLFTLSPKSTFSKQLPATGWHLNVELPSAGWGLNTPRIALSRRPFVLDYYARATWVNRATTMVQTLLVESFTNTRKIVSVTGEAFAPGADYALVTELREFQAQYDIYGEPPAVLVRINAKLVGLPGRTIVATKSAEHLERAKGTDLNSIIDAYDEALGRVMRRVVEWTLTALPKPKKLSFREPG